VANQPRDFPYTTHLDVYYRQLELIDVAALAAACTHRWYNQTLCRSTTRSSVWVSYKANITGTSTTPKTSSSTW